MQFVKNGPDVPEHLLQSHEDGDVVFFCGAGISYPAGLPSFRGLVDQIYTELGATKTPIELQAYDNRQYDATLDLLERRLPGGRIEVRRALAKVLHPKLRRKAATSTHSALLQLARDRRGNARLVTTNFDRIFEALLVKAKPALPGFAAPLLPIPKNSRWHGVVYLHGLLPKTHDEMALNRLVLSSGDFGLAYLTERWAARFVSELFRNFVVCFVGYSISDPVLRYMMDALAADRMLGETTPQAYAFGSYGAGEKDLARNEWEAKGVTPILYEVPKGTHEDHSGLHLSLRQWADTHRDGVLGKERIVVQYAMGKPFASTVQDDFVGRVLWALSDVSGLPAKRFGELDPVPSLDWLDALTEPRFKHADLIRFGVVPRPVEDAKLAFSLARRPTPYGLAPWMTLVGSGTLESQWDEVMLQLANWLAKHLANPDLILWVAKHGGRLHDRFAWVIRDQLKAKPLSPVMQTLWRVVLAGRLKRHWPRHDLFGWRESFKREGLTSSLRLELRDILAPRAQLREPFGGADDEGRDETHEPSRVKDVVDWEIVLGGDHVHSALQDFTGDAQWHEALPDLLADFTSLLRDSLDLMRELGGADDKQDASYVYQPSISEHPQNNDFRDWTALIDLAREAWLATAKRFPERARLEVERWSNAPYPLFKRLVFFAATDAQLFTPNKALGWLLSDDDWWLWSVESEREALRLLVSLAPRLESPELQRLESAILRGPPREMFRSDAEAVQIQRIFDREIWLRLAKCRQTGAELSADAQTRLDAISKQYPMWELSEDERDEFPVWMGTGDEWREFVVAPKEQGDLIEWLRQPPKPNVWQEDDWRQRCRDDFPGASSALITLAREGQWPEARWREALQAWSDESLVEPSWRDVAPLVNLAPDAVLKALAHGVSYWLKAVAKTFEQHEEIFWNLIRRIVQIHRSGEAEADDDPVFKAINHPVGHVTEAALAWWDRRKLEDGQRFPNEIRPIFSELCDTRHIGLRHGRVLLASRAIVLFRVDPAWAAEYLLPLFDWQRSFAEARTAWEGFLWSPRLYRPLMEVLKQPFLNTASHYTDLGKHSSQFAAVLTFAALEPADTFSRAELADAIGSLPDAGLQRAASALVDALRSAGEQRGDYWRNRVHPFLKFIWPKSRERMSPAISESFARLCIEAREVFPEAFRELRHWLLPVEHPEYVVHLLNEAKLCERFPSEALAFLNTVIGDEAQWPPTKLMECLTAIRTSQPSLETDSRYRRLMDYLRRHGKA